MQLVGGGKTDANACDGFELSRKRGDEMGQFQSVNSRKAKTVQKMPKTNNGEKKKCADGG